MGSRVRNRKSIKRLFECYIIAEAPWSPPNGRVNQSQPARSPSEANGITPIIRSVYPTNFNKPDVVKTAAQFAFPCPTLSETVELFTFVLTNEDSKWTFGYCRHPHGSKSCVLFLTFLPWQEIFYRALNYVAEVDDEKLTSFLERMYATPVPDAGTCLYITTHAKPFICPCPSDLSLPSIPENRNVSEFYNALTTESMLTLFAALLSERRIVVTSKKISRLSSLVVACNLFLFPMSWQHIFIPVLPIQLQDYMSAPMPFLIGVPLPVWDRIPAESLGQVVRVDADSDTVTTPFPEDLDSMPEDVVYLLRKNLTGERVLGDGLARAFLRALAQLMGHYQDAVRNDGESFDSDLFVQFAHPTHREYIESKLLGLQIFQQFMDERLQKIKSGSCESDEFELESLAWRSSRANGRNGLRVLGSLGKTQNRTAIKKAGKAVIMSVKRESESIIESVKQNSALKSAVRSIKESGKSVKQKSSHAYSDIRSKFHVAAPSSRASAIEYGHTPATKTYRRHASTLNPHGLEFKPGIDGHHTLSATSSHHMLRSSDDNLVLSTSSSASKMNEITALENGVQVRPRLSKSEENLIDLDTPDGLGLGLTLENPLYDLLTDNNVFEDSDKTDAELLNEYGLTDYFAQMNFSGSDSLNISGSDILNNSQNNDDHLGASANSSNHKTGNNVSFGAAWTKFD
ncbi:DENN domain-containing protein 1A [Orchesella cincta]|uniref:DENN domain-containing protein 1A n=1 Tax=Orchesella cincta TaxID=48709 RepID=A0A1D2NMI0_ORCCI|nr:DENN domain-containing protein 1A [Orchesella cincta]